jgi:UDP-N-acetyl-D-galactosamine dehydrogenase
MAAPGKILVLGLTFKENVPDLRNTKVIDVVTGLKSRGHEVWVHDPVANGGEAERLYGFTLLSSLDGQRGYDTIVGAVRHDDYLALNPAYLAQLVRDGGLIADIKGLWRHQDRLAGRQYWQL